MNEKDFSSQVEEALTRFGWRWMHMKPAKSGKGAWMTRTNPGGIGFLDYVAVHAVERRLLFIELKGDKGEISPEQCEWLSDLRECSSCIYIEVYVWYPKDSDYMLEVLRADEQKDVSDG